MRSCPACGTANGETDDFCGNCGAYLGWSRGTTTPASPPADPAPASPPAAPAPPSSPAGDGPDSPSSARDSGSPSSASGSGAPSAAGGSAAPRGTPAPASPRGASGSAPAPDAAPPRPPDAAGPDVPASGPPGPDGAPRPPGPSPRPGTGPARRPPEPSPVPPRVPPAGAPGQRQDGDDDGPVGAVQPAKPVARRPVTRTPVAEDRSDGPPCPSCATPNSPERRFCRRCAAPLRPAEPVPKLPWWRTVWPFRRRVRGGSGRLVRGLVVLGAVLGLVAGGFLLFPAGRTAVEDIRDKLGDAAEISPVKVTADAQVPGHPAGDATDGVTNTYWGTPAPGATVSCRFAQPFRLVAVVVHTGASKEPAEFRAQARPVRADLVVREEDGTRHTKELTLNDKPGPQTVRTGISDVVEVRFVVRAAAGTGKGRHVALGELEFRKRS